MAVYKPLVLGKDETDIDKIMSKLYRFSRDLKSTLSNLSLEDNTDASVLDILDSRADKTRKISFSADGLTIDLQDYETGLHTSLEQTSEKISLLVDSGSVVETMLSRMELYGEYITLKTGEVIIQTQNMSLDRNGNASSRNMTSPSAMESQRAVLGIWARWRTSYPGQTSGCIYRRENIT